MKYIGQLTLDTLLVGVVLLFLASAITFGASECLPLNSDWEFTLDYETAKSN
jgi:hypothetical protein